MKGKVKGKGKVKVKGKGKGKGSEGVRAEDRRKMGRRGKERETGETAEDGGRRADELKG